VICSRRLRPSTTPQIYDHYGQINPVKNAERILQGLPEWEPITAPPQFLAETGPRERGAS
jgi:hypothetical protein